MIRLKNENQLAGIRASCALLSRMYAELRPMIVAGITTEELDQFAERFILENGGKPAFLNYGDKSNPYPATLCISINEEVIHGIPGKRKIQPGDIVGIDSGIELGGYFSDAAFTVAVEPVAPETEKLLRVTQECLIRAIAAVRPGARIHDISRAVFSHARANGYGVVRQYCGHGVGFSQHEDPQVPNYVGSGPNPRMVPGMVLAIEPMINAGGDGVGELDDGWTIVTLDGSKSAHFEHTVAVTATGSEVMTSW
ncbi:MAG: type I methionyl aminopeptidase [Spirochaetes bacterium GWB1_48_6]|nr:MAG: type I methionyl aminopeptidase [Spirochaetes bacterium GWB1_48_6]